MGGRGGHEIKNCAGQSGTREALPGHHEIGFHGAELRVKQDENRPMNDDMTDRLARDVVLVSMMVGQPGCVVTSSTRSHQPKLRPNSSLSVAEQ